MKRSEQTADEMQLSFERWTKADARRLACQGKVLETDEGGNMLKGCGLWITCDILA